MGKLISIFTFVSMLTLMACSGWAANDPAYQWHDGYYGTPDANTVLLMHFDEGSGTTTYDASASVNDGVLLGYELPVWTVGQFGSGLDFCGDTVSGVYVADDTSIRLSGDYTIEAWIKPDFDVYPEYNWWSIVNKLPNFNLSLWDMQDALVWQSRDSFDWPVIDYRAGYGLLIRGEWTHVASTWDDSTQTVKLYVNGNMVGEETFPTFHAMSDTVPLTIGCDNASDTDPSFVTTFSGIIDEVRISNTVRDFIPKDNVAVGEYVSIEAQEFGIGIQYYADPAETTTNYAPSWKGSLEDSWQIADTLAETGIVQWLDAGDEEAGRLSPIDPAVNKRFYEVRKYQQ